MESGGGSLNVTKQIYFDHPNITLTHIHIAYANVSCHVGGILRGWHSSCHRHARAWSKGLGWLGPL